jgi:hypothetical protein
VDDPADVPGNTRWAGVLPLRQVWDTPIPADDLPAGIAVPDGIADRPAPC